jgi:hypothetical protein
LAAALADNTATLTAIGNDFGFDRVFARQVRAFATGAMSLSASRPAAHRRTCWRASQRLRAGVGNDRHHRTARRPAGELCDHWNRRPDQEARCSSCTICELVGTTVAG